MGQFGDSILSALPELRALAESLMVDTVLVERVSAVGVEDGKGGISYPRLPIYQGKAKIQTTETLENSPASGGHSFVIQRYEVQTPWDAGPFAIGDVVTIVEAGRAAHAVGTQYRIAGLHEKSLQTAQRLLADEVTA